MGVTSITGNENPSLVVCEARRDSLSDLVAPKPLNVLPLEPVWL
jgi:hypothetical protein